MSSSSTMCPIIAVLAGLTLVLVSSALPSQAANDQKPKLAINGTAVCPNGWTPAVASSSDVTHHKLCVRVTEQLLTWQKARQDCRASRGFLIKLDSALSLDNVPLDEYLKMRGLDTVWTGMHHEHGTLMWDDLQPHMVKAYHGKAQASGWKKRDWKFNLDSFKRNADTCGVFEAHDDDSAEISDVRAAIRTRRSPQQPPGAGSLRARLDQRPRGVLDNEEVVPSGSPAEERRLDPSQSSVSQGLQEGMTDIVDVTDTSDPQIPVNNSLSIDLTDTSDPQIPANNSLNIDITDTSDPQIPANNSLGIDLTDTSDPQMPVNNTLNIDLTDTSDPQIPANNSLSIDLTDTSDPHSTDTNNDALNSTSSIATTKSSVHRATETLNAVRDSAHAQNAVSAKTWAGTSTFATPMITTTNHTVAVTNNTLPSKSTITTQFPTTTSNHSLAKESQNVDAQSNVSSLTNVGRDDAKDLTGDLLSKRSTTSMPVSVMVTPRLATSTGIATTTATTTIPTTPTSTLKPTAGTRKTAAATAAQVTANEDLKKSSTITEKDFEKNILITTAGGPADTGAATAKTTPSSVTHHDININKPTTTSFTSGTISKRPTTNIPVVTTIDPHRSSNIPVVTTAILPGSTNIPVVTTADLLKSSNIPVAKTTNLPGSTNIPVVITADLLKSKSIPVANTTNLPGSTNIPVVTTTDLLKSTNIPVANTTNLPGSTNIPVVTTTNLPGSTNTPDLNTKDRPRSTNNPHITTTDLLMSTIAKQYLSTSPANINLNNETSVPVNMESFTDKGLSKPSPTTQVSLMITSDPPMSTVAITTTDPPMSTVATTTTDPPMSTVAATTPLSTVSVQKHLVTGQSVPDDLDSSSSKLGYKPNMEVTKSATAETELHLSTPTTTTTTTTHSPLTENQNVFIPQSAPFMSKPAAGKLVSKRSTTNIPVMTTTDLPTSTVATTTSAASLPTQPSLTTSYVVTAQPGVQNSTDVNAPNDSLSTVASNAQATTGIPISILNTENTTIVALTSTKATSQADNTTVSTPVSTLQLTEAPTLTTKTETRTINKSLTTTGVTNNAAAAADLTRPGLDDSSEVIDHANSPQYSPTTTLAPGDITTPDITDQSSKEVDPDPAVNSTHVTGNGDTGVNHTSNITGQNQSASSGSVSSSDSDASNNNNPSIPKKLPDLVKNNQAKIDRAGSSKADTVTESIDSSQSDSTTVSQDASDEVGGSSSSTDEPPRDTPVQAPSNTLSLNQCEEEHPSVCVTEAVEELLLVGHCDRNWYGHRLLDRCYKPVDFMVKALEARQNCLHYSASLATVDTGFYGNITTLLLSYFAPGSKVWVDASLNMDVPGDGQCAALEDGQLHTVDCNLRLPFICQKDVRYYAPYPDDGVDSKRPMIYVQNLTSFQSQTLWCPLRMSAFDDVILWFKDGRPIVNEDDDDDAMAFRPANGHMPNRLDIDLSILEHLGDGGSRIPKPAMLQGLYWCEIFRREPFHRVVSHKIFLKFTDVITLYCHITTEPVNHVTAAIFNRMGHMIGLPALIERRLATVNKNITHFMRGAFPIVRDIISFVPRTNPDTGRSEFTTYICLATGDLSSRTRGSLVDLYISVFYNTLVLIEDQLQKEWNLTVPIRHAVALTMADMCPEANLFDRSTGLSATFPSTAVNNPAVSRHMCDGAPIGNAFCKGDLQSGAYWDVWTVTNPCSDFKHTLSNKPDNSETGSSIGPDKLAGTKGNGGGPDHEKPPKQDLVELNQVTVNKENLADVTDRLADVVDQSGDLSALDIETIAQVVHRIVSLDKLSSEISDRLVATANLVLDASEGELRKAEQSSHATSRLLADLETFGAKAEMGAQNWVRYVTPNVAMEMWNLQDPSDVIIGFGARQAFSWTAPLSEPRIQTIKDRMWAEQHLSTFDVAIQLPESLVKNTVQYSDSSLRLTMFIYRKTGLFVGSRGPDKGQRSVNSAVISASLGGRRISSLEDKVRLVFKPFQEPRDGDQSTQCVFWDTESSGGGQWSTSGCVYNGTVNGRTVCLCDHLTNFAILTDFYGDRVSISKGHETALTVLTIIGLILSIIGLAITIITFLAFKKLRQGRAQQTLFNLSIALLCFQTTFLIGVKLTSVMPLCLTISVLLHYFILVSFAWMLIEAVLQYLTFVKVLGTYVSRYTLKTVLPAWGLPLLPVIAVLVTDYRLYLGRAHYCWMDLQAYYYAFALPVGIIIVFNIIMFCIIIVSLATKPKGLRSNQTNSSATKTSLKAAITIFVLLGLTWIFGYLAIEDARLPFQYAFTILSSLQGFLIFMLMVARRKQVRVQWEMMCCLRWKRQQNNQKKLSPSFSNSTTCSTSNSHSLANDSIILSSSTGSRKSLHV